MGGGEGGSVQSRDGEREDSPRTRKGRWSGWCSMTCSPISGLCFQGKGGSEALPGKEEAVAQEAAWGEWPKGAQSGYWLLPKLEERKP